MCTQARGSQPWPARSRGAARAPCTRRSVCAMMCSARTPQWTTVPCARQPETDRRACCATQPDTPVGQFMSMAVSTAAWRGTAFTSIATEDFPTSQTDASAAQCSLWPASLSHGSSSAPQSGQGSAPSACSEVLAGGLPITRSGGEAWSAVCQMPSTSVRETHTEPHLSPHTACS